VGFVFQVVRDFCPHDVGHYLGMDVHDTALMSKNNKLEPGMIITIEPGTSIFQFRADILVSFKTNVQHVEGIFLLTSLCTVMFSFLNHSP